MTDMNNQYPGDTPPPGDGYGQDEAREEVRDNNRTLTVIATVLGVLLLIAAIVIGWMLATRDDDDSTSAADTTTTSTTPLTTPVETVTATSTEPDPVTVTNTVPVEETTQTITQQTTAAPPAPPTTTAPAPGPSCDPEALRADGHDFVDGLLFCESGWARGGQDQSDYVRIFQWVNESWEMYAPTGESAVTGYPCYDTQAMAAQGAPSALINQTLDCSDG
ncbi:hypothetical protein HMPREF0290_2975 [Corynebacterium efficiens YS-314]|nr:hypothetical protein [Corynebacterium efficiens]EEW48409.1 hypothetical protein HMPREF0290_2975 [Corynebacterium efficiens YS-314]